MKNSFRKENFLNQIGGFHKNSQKKNLRGHFWDLPFELLTEFDLDRDILIVIICSVIRYF